MRPICPVCNQKPCVIAYHKNERTYYQNRCGSCIRKGKKIKSSAVIEGSGADSGSNQLVGTAESAASGVGSQGVQVEAQDGDSGLVACPHCNRRFNDKAADRHIPICTDIKAKPKTLLKKSGKPAVSAALPARTKLIGRIL